jgi:hypothetical protein
LCNPTFGRTLHLKAAKNTKKHEDAFSGRDALITLLCGLRDFVVNLRRADTLTCRASSRDLPPHEKTSLPPGAIRKGEPPPNNRVA